MTTFNEDEYIEDEPQVYDGPPIPVHITSQIVPSGPTYTENLAADFGSTGTFILQPAGSAQPVQILQRRYRRNRAVVIVQSFGGTSPASAASISNTGAPVTSPGIGAVLATAAVPNAGTYSVNWQILLGGTLGAIDRNNVALQVNGVTVATSNNGINSGTVYPQTSQQIVIPAGATVQLITIAAGTAASVYAGNFVLTSTTSIGAATAAILHNRPDVLTLPTPPPNTGIQITTTPYAFVWESQQPLYGVGIGGQVAVSVIDETYAEPTT
jgi:hypothetical protein